MPDDASSQYGKGKGKRKGKGWSTDSEPHIPAPVPPQAVPAIADGPVTESPPVDPATWWSAPTYAWTWHEPQPGGWEVYPSFLVTEVINDAEASALDVWAPGGKGAWDTINVPDHPTFVILDIGCTRSMGSRPAVTNFVREGVKYGLKFEYLA